MKQSGTHVPAALEIVRCSEGGREYIKEKKYKCGSHAHLCIVAELPLYSMDKQALTVTRRLAKRLARDYIRTAHALSAVVIYTATAAGGKPALQVYDKREGSW